MTSRKELREKAYTNFIVSWQYVAKLPDGQFEVIVGSEYRFVLEDQGKAERLFNKLMDLYYSPNFPLFPIGIPSGP